jgi:hypothetical protein
MDRIFDKLVPGAARFCTSFAPAPYRWRAPPITRSSATGTGRRIGIHWQEIRRAGVTADIGLGRVAMDGAQKKHDGWSWWYTLFLLQFIAVLWPPFYNRIEPAWLGLPFFYWYQLLWVIISGLITAVIYIATDE